MSIVEWKKEYKFIDILDWISNADRQRLSEDNVWSLIDSDSGKYLCVVPGRQKVNQIDYLVTEIPVDWDNIPIVEDKK
jgi:hypothetical protein